MATWHRLEETPVTVSEKNPRITLKYVGLNVSDEEEIDNDIRNSTSIAPDVFQNLSKLDYSHDAQGGGVYLLEVEYGIPDADNPPLGETPLAEQDRADPPTPFEGQGDEGQPPNNEDGPSQTGNDSQFLGPEYSFDTTGGTVKVTQSKETREGYGINGALLSTAGVPDYKQAINVTKDGVEGTEIGVGKLRFSYTGRYKFITRAFLRTLRSLTYSTNTGTYFGFETGEVLYVGSTGNHDGSESPWKVTHNYEVGINETNIVIFGSLATPATSLIVAEKKAHDYLWCTYSDAVDGNVMLIRPTAAYVERMYDSRSLKPLGV